MAEIILTAGIERHDDVAPILARFVLGGGEPLPVDIDRGRGLLLLAGLSAFDLGFVYRFEFPYSIRPHKTYIYSIRNSHRVSR